MWMTLWTTFLLAAIGLGSAYKYMAAVSEFKPVGQVTQPRLTLSTNTKIVERVISNAKAKKSDIVVLPEYSLFPHDIVTSRKELRQFLQEVLPEGKLLGWNPCEEDLPYGETEFLAMISCAAKASHIYVVVNLGELERCSQDDPTCPNDHGYYYNCNVVFNPEGDLIARYRKSNLYYEYPYDVPPRETVMFRTNFGVTFGLITCFDIMWEEPLYDLLKNYSVKDVIVPSAWTDRMPFYLSPQIMQGNAIKHDINILQSEYHNPYYAGLGSGVYQRRNGTDKYYYSTNTNMYLTVSEVDTVSRQERAQEAVWTFNLPSVRKVGAEEGRDDVFTVGVSPTHRMKVLDMSTYPSVKLVDPEGSVSVCDGVVCCRAEYNIRESVFSNTYRLVVKDGVHNVGTAYAWYHQVCALLRCMNEHDVNSCSSHGDKMTPAEVFERLQIAANFDNPDNVMPSVLKSDLSLSRDWRHQINGTGVALTMDTSIRDVQVVLLYGRNFNK